MNVKKLCRRENNSNNIEDCAGVYLSRIQCSPMSSLSVSVPGNVEWCPTLALGSLFNTTGDPLSVSVSFTLVWAPLFCPSSFPPAQDSGVVHLTTREHRQYFLHLPPEGASGEIRKVHTLGHLWRALFSFLGRWWECFPAPSPYILVCPRFFPIMYGFW